MPGFFTKFYTDLGYKRASVTQRSMDHSVPKVPSSGFTIQRLNPHELYMPVIRREGVNGNIC